MHVLVRVDVIEPETSSPECMKLRAYLGLKLSTSTRCHEVFYSEPHLVRRELSCRVNQSGDTLLRQDGRPVDKYYVQSDTQAWQAPCPPDSVRCSPASHHQTGSA